MPRILRSLLLYIHRDRADSQGPGAGTSTSTFTQLHSFVCRGGLNFVLIMWTVFADKSVKGIVCLDRCLMHLTGWLAWRGEHGIMLDRNQKTEEAAGSTCLCSWPSMFQSSDSHAYAVDHDCFKVHIHMPVQLTMTVSKFKFTCLCSWPWIFQSSDSHAYAADHEYFKVEIHMPMQLTMNISKLRFTCLCSWPWIFQSWDSKIFSGELVASFDWSDRWVEANM